MNRRDFLRFKTEHGIRTLELSCQRLHLHYVERRVTGGRLDTDDPLDQDFDPTEDGEPPTAFEERTTEQLFEHLERDLDGEQLRARLESLMKPAERRRLGRRPRPAYES